VIPIYDTGTWPDGRPFFVMKLAGGRSLDESIAVAETLEERLALLPHVVAAVDALAYAHGRRIVHRDLKPPNVLVGAFGETFVIDWGLAKRLDDPSQDPDVAEPSTEGTKHGLTLAGAVLGTPAYMPPEQAAGAAVDARADVYSLGAILYHVLSGRPPYRGSESGRVVAEVLAKPPEPLSRVQEGLPIEPVTIVETAMRRAAAERYPSALEMGANLRRFQTGQLVGAHRYTAWQMLRRFVARHRFAVAAGALATLAAFTPSFAAFPRTRTRFLPASATRWPASSRPRAAVAPRFVQGRTPWGPSSRASSMRSVSPRISPTSRGWSRSSTLTS
jgi:serine/threonine protein kinase